MNLADTIVAVATPPGRGGIGIVRISGAKAGSIASTIIRVKSGLSSWKASLGELIDLDGAIVDEVIVTFFAAPRSYTAEDMAEISCHGSPVVLRHCLERAMSEGARLAEPGEFTLRAFVNGRIDLPQAEAVRDLIDSTTLYQARVAARQTQGAVSKFLAPVKGQLVELIALLEAGIDFAEDDISVAPSAEILRRLDPVIQQTGALARSYIYGNLVRNGFSLAIVGPPNAGKSSLFNRLLERDRAIVTDIPGTTRDLVSESADFSGIPVRLVDTAGIRETGEVIEKLGIERSYQAMADADLTIVVVDGTSVSGKDDESLKASAASQGRSLIVRNKSDLPGFQECDGELSVSALSGEGITGLRRMVLELLIPERAGNLDGGAFITSLRQERLLSDACAGLDRAKVAILGDLPHELILLDLYCALEPLDAITGRTTANYILNQIFSSFCIGK